VQLGGRRVLALPAAFVTFMAAGAALGAAGLPLPQVEGVIALSVLALGCAVGMSGKMGSDSNFDPARKQKWSLTPVFLVAAFALFHGHAHGTEMGDFSAPWQYFAGFLLATAALHASGVTAGILLKSRPAILRAGGAAIGLAGGLLVVSL
jgi:urease accessory protein